MVNAGTNHLGIDRSKTAGGRRRRQAASRKRKLANANLYQVTVTRFGLYRDGSEWKLTALSAKRSKERLVSDRQGGTKSEVVERPKVSGNDPERGLVVKTFDTKKEATERYYWAESWNKYEAGKYYHDDGHELFKVDRDRWHKWVRQV